MKMLTVRQPWASLIACGAKTIETRPFGTKYRGPLAIHAASFRPVEGEEYGTGWYWEHDVDVDVIVSAGERWQQHPAPLGAVVAVADVVDVVPIVDPHAWDATEAVDSFVVVGNYDWLTVTPVLEAINGCERSDITGQLPFGDFTPGRHAWMLDNVRRIDPVPAKGFQGLRDIDPAVGAQVQAALQVSA